MPPISILLPPSEGKAVGGGRPSWKPASGRFGRSLTSHRREIAECLAAGGGGDARLLGVSGENLRRAREANATLIGSPTLPASRRYTGVVWDHIGFDSLGAPARQRAAESIIVFSALLGLAGIDDPVPDYKLKMGATLPTIGKLTVFWRDRLSEVLNTRLAGTWVIDLLPVEHRGAWEPTPSRYAGLSTVRFVEKSGKVAGHDAKAAKGALVRHLLESRTTPEKSLSTWRHERFRLSY
jgi:uncharacterized protein